MSLHLPERRISPRHNQAFNIAGRSLSAHLSAFTLFMLALAAFGAGAQTSLRNQPGYYAAVLQRI